MRFFFDENMSPVVIEPLRPMLSAQHELQSWSEFDGGRLRGMDDKPLLIEVAVHFEVFVTLDRAQLVDHHQELVDSGLHWIGLRHPKTRGLHALASTSASLLAGLPHAIDIIKSWEGNNGCWLSLRRLEQQATQRVKVRNVPVQTNTRRLRRESS